MVAGLAPSRLVVLFADPGFHLPALDREGFYFPWGSEIRGRGMIQKSTHYTSWHDDRDRRSEKAATERLRKQLGSLTWKQRRQLKKQSAFRVGMYEGKTPQQVRAEVGTSSAPAPQISLTDRAAHCGTNDKHSRQCAVSRTTQGWFRGPSQERKTPETSLTGCRPG
jgi:hypothetical protein